MALPKMYQKALELNGEAFFTCLRNYRYVLVVLPGGVYIPVGKHEVWAVAQHRVLLWDLRNDVYSDGRDVLVIRGAMPLTNLQP